MLSLRGGLLQKSSVLKRTLNSKRNREVYFLSRKKIATKKTRGDGYSKLVDEADNNGKGGGGSPTTL